MLILTWRWALFSSRRGWHCASGSLKAGGWARRSNTSEYCWRIRCLNYTPTSSQRWQNLSCCNATSAEHSHHWNPLWWSQECTLCIKTALPWTFSLWLHVILPIAVTHLTMSCPPIQKSTTDMTSIQVAWRPVDGECPLQKDKRDKKRRKAGVPFTKFKKITPPWPSGRTQRTKHQPCGKLHEHTWALGAQKWHWIDCTSRPILISDLFMTQPLQAIKPSISAHHLP